ncbi:hypothetical protein FB451DRAFT_1185305 [Mycena latifolia]|nr:hypothetical protein FB451DRAFT_1185305 [Mycena latifolia]
MHPALNIRNILKLPLAVRIHANAALEGSLDGLSISCRQIKSAPLEQQFLILPVLYKTLTTADLPDLISGLDSSLPTHGTVWALSGIESLSANHIIPVEALAEVWSRCWAWLEFLDTYREVIAHPSLDGGKGSIFCISTIIAMRLSGNLHIARLIDETPGIRTILVRGWAADIRNMDLQYTSTFGVLCELMAHVLDSTSQNLDEAIDGAGSAKALASLVVNHINLVVADPYAGDKTWYLTAVDTPFQIALLEGGIIGALTSAVGLLSRRPPYRRLLFLYLFVLHSHFSSSYRQIVQSLQAGLLQALVQYGRHPVISEPKDVLKSEDIVGGIIDLLTTSLVHADILVQMHILLSDSCFHGAGNSFSSSEDTFPRWRAFWNLTPRRIEMLERHESKSQIRRRVCDHLECQILDWKSRGGHRDICQELRLMHQENTIITARGRSFLRALLHHDYLGMRKVLLPQLLDFMRRWPDKTPYILFDYTDPLIPCLATIRSVGELERFSSYISRAQNSGGRIQLHIVKILDGCEPRLWMIPLHSATGEGLKELKEIAKESVKQREVGRMKTLLNQDVLEIH